jgi:hypothetical protein
MADLWNRGFLLARQAHRISGWASRRTVSVADSLRNRA